MYRFKRLNTRLTVLLLIPVALLLITGGVLTYVFTRDLMLAQWNKSAVLELTRAAQSIELRIKGPLLILNSLFGGEAAYSGPGEELAAFLKNLNGVVDAVFIPNPSFERRRGRRGGSAMGMGFHRSRIAKVADPEFSGSPGEKTVTTTLELLDRQGEAAGILNIRMDFDFLLADVAGQGWWHSYQACLVTRGGRYLAHADQGMAGRKVMGETGDPFEEKVVERISRARSGTVASEGSPPGTIAGFYTLEPVPWVLILFGRGETVLKPIIVYRNVFSLGSVVMLILIIVLIRGYTRRMVGEIQTLSKKAGDVANGNYGSPVPVKGLDEISQLVQSYNKMVEGLRERDLIRDSFGRYVDPEFARQLLDRPEKSRLGGERRQVVILMSDIRGFTPLSESLAPEIIIDVLNRYFSSMIRIIQARRGIIVDFFGDAVLVFFDPLDNPVGVAAETAMACAFDMQERMAKVNRDLMSRGLPELFMGIGMHTGPVVVGNIGSSARAKYGIVGSAVNVTSRIQAKAGEGEILVSLDLLDFLPDIRVGRSFQAELKGIRTPMTLNVVRRP